LLPCELRDRAKVHFCSPAGTDAVEAALKLAQVGAASSRSAARTTG
jgi:diaminobutyrate-2-oxoglutarate transaminase